MRRLLRFKMLPYEWGEITPTTSKSMAYITSRLPVRVPLRDVFESEVVRETV